MVILEPKNNGLTWPEARFLYSAQGDWHPTLRAVKTGFFYRVNGQEVFEFVAVSEIDWVEERGSWGIVRTKPTGWRWFE
jgi:hypothetical protein